MASRVKSPLYLWKRTPRPDKGREEALQRLIASLALRALAILDPGERKTFLESEIRSGFGFLRVEIMFRPEGPERFSAESTRIRDIFSRVVGILEGVQNPFLSAPTAQKFGGAALLRNLGVTYALPVVRGEQRLALLLVDSTPRSQLDPRTEESLLQAAGQVAIVIENSLLLQGKLNLEQALSRQANMAQLGEMTARIAHEIKNPLSAIKTIVQVMKEDGETFSKHGRDLELVEGEINRLSATVSQLLDFARPGREAADEVSLCESAEAVLSFLGRDIERSRVQIENDIPDSLPPIHASRAAFREILLNLLLNAIQAGGEGTRIRLMGWEGILEDGSERFVVLVLEDDGPGIPADLQEKVFQPFFTTKPRGTGLGLSIVRRNIEHLGGRISLESPARDCKGTRFIMHLPV